jgi:hypothetical protein
MFRKLAFATAAAITLGTAALAPTSASAWWDGGHQGWHHGWHGWWPHYYGYSYGYSYSCRRWVPTPWGPRLRWVC